MNARVRLIALAAFVAGFVCSMPVFADDAAAGGSAAAPEAASKSADAGTASPEPTGQTATDGATTLASGPLLEQRQELLDHIHQAGAHGIGTANYMMAFKALEEQVQGGASEAQIKPRVESLTGALIEQLKRAQVLKAQRPLPPSASQQGGESSGGVATASASAGLGGGITPAIVNKIKSRLGGIDIPDDLIEKAKNSEQGRELMKKYGIQ